MRRCISYEKTISNPIGCTFLYRAHWLRRTTGRIYKVYQAWCRENNHGYARTAKEFREQLAGYLGGTFADVTTRQKGNTYYRDFTITEETKELYAKEYGYEETEFLAG